VATLSLGGAAPEDKWPNDELDLRPKDKQLKDEVKEQLEDEAKEWPEDEMELQPKDRWLEDEVQQLVKGEKKKKRI
jgi:hypothetical protein